MKNMVVESCTRTPVRLMLFLHAITPSLGTFTCTTVVVDAAAAPTKAQIAMNFIKLL